MSGDPSQDYFSDGITEDIITELSRFSELFVIARNSSFQYKGKSVDVRQVGRELGVRYVLEGSIRRAGDRIRISAQLIDAVTGAHRWAERYDRKLEDVFAVQDEVARTIVAVLAVHVNKAETERVLATPPATWQAYEHYLRAADTLVSYHSSLNKDDLLQGRRGLRQVLAIDPNYARAHAALSRTYVSLWVHRWDDDCPWSAALDRAYQSAREAVRLAPNLPAAHVALGWALIWMRQHEAAIAEFERAIGLNPNLSDPVFAWTLVFAGEPARAIQTLKAHMRLDPFYQPHAPWWLGLCLLHAQTLRGSPATSAGVCIAGTERWPSAITGWPPPMPSWVSSTRPGPRRLKGCASTLGSQSVRHFLLGPASAPRMPSISRMACARRGIRSDSVPAAKAIVRGPTSRGRTSAFLAPGARGNDRIRVMTYRYGSVERTAGVPPLAAEPSPPSTLSAQIVEKRRLTLRLRLGPRNGQEGCL